MPMRFAGVDCISLNPAFSTLFKKRVLPATYSSNRLRYSHLFRSNEKEKSTQNPSRFRGWLSILIGTSSTIFFGYEYLNKLRDPPKVYTISPETQRAKLVLLGSGWASTNLLKTLAPGLFDVTVISPRNHFLFTPLLTEAATGTVEVRSIVESIRKICKKTGANYFEAKAYDLDDKKNEIYCIDAQGQQFTLQYDYLVIGVGAKNNTFNTPGVQEHAYFLKEIPDARRIRCRITECFEKAALPTTSDEQRAKLLHFLVVGGGPTGVELAAELYDFLHEDLEKLYPSLKKFAKVTVFQSADHVLNTYDRRISDFTEGLFNKRSDIQLITNAKVVRVLEDSVVYKRNLHPCSTNEATKMEKAKLSAAIPTTETRESPSGDEESVDFGLCVWATGIQPHTFTRSLMKKLQPEFPHAKALVTDSHLRLLNTKKGTVFVAGDCATIEMPSRLSSNIEKVFQSYDTDANGILSIDEIRVASEKIRDVYPQLDEHMKKLVKKIVKGKKTGVNLEEFHKFFLSVTQMMKPFPATAQVASQQGRYLAQQLYAIEKKQKTKPFEYSHFGDFIYLGQDMAAINFNFPIPIIAKGALAYWLWRSAYWSKQVSPRTKTLIAFDWCKKTLFGRDVSQF